jgi:hypothetical protein
MEKKELRQVGSKTRRSLIKRPAFFGQKELDFI